jgi:hypothetical protein
MPVRFECPTCKTTYDVDDELAGKTIMCRGCQKRGQVRGAAAPSRAATPTATTTAPATATATATATSLAKPGLIPPTPTRREAMSSLWIYGILAVGSIATGAILARTKVLRNLSFGSEEEPEPRRRKGPRPGDTAPGGNPPPGPPPAGPKGP